MKENILDNLKSARWSFHNLLPLYNAAINQRCVKQNLDIKKPLFARSLATFTATTEACHYSYKLEQNTLKAPEGLFEDFLAKNNIPGLPIDFDSNEIQLLTDALGLMEDKSKNSYYAWEYAIEGTLRISGGDFYGASHPHVASLILLGDKFFKGSRFDQALSLVHEMGHQELFLINTLDRLVQTGSEYSMLHAPFQGKERPPIARLHSLFALFRMVQFERENGLNTSTNLDLLVANLSSFKENELTDFGSKVVENIHFWTAK